MRALALLAAGALLASCSRASPPVSVSVAPTLLFPRNVLQNATSVTLAVYTQTSTVTCNATTGIANGVTTSTPVVDSTTLGACPAGSTELFCGTLTITESSAPLVFAAAAQNASNATIAYGCASSVVDAASLSLDITMIQSVPTATCGNGIIEPTEQCDPPAPEGGTDAVCDSQCHSKEELLSVGSTTPRGPTFLLWPSQAGQSEDLLAFFTDANAAGGPNANVALRLMSATLEPLSTPPAAATAILAPNDTTSTLPPLPAPGNQSQPSAAVLDGVYFYAFRDDAFGAPGVYLRSFDATLAGQQAQASPIVIDGPPATSVVDGGADAGGSAADGGPGDSSPSVAVNGAGALFIAWLDVASGQIVGRTYTPTGGALSPLATVSASGTTNENVQVAGTATGWLVVWDDTTQIKLRAYSGNGTADGAEIVVSNGSHSNGVQDRPAIAVLSDGRAAVLWADHGTSEGADIFVQRYDANVVPVAGDQTTAINNVVTAGDQVTPTVAGASAAGGAFVAAWVDVASGQVRGRILQGTTGFDSNPIDGTTNEFLASIATGQQRENPAVAVGGSGPWAAIGWDVGGVVSVRRFPTSTESQ
ncbi:MAG: hypothetical protein ACLQVI_17210 [Polyangiaceae bacterium]